MADFSGLTWQPVGPLAATLSSLEALGSEGPLAWARAVIQRSVRGSEELDWTCSRPRTG